MLQEKKGFLVIYPEYFDVNLSRKMGRKLPKNLCIQNPSVEHLMHAAKKLKLEYELEREKHYPGDAFRRRGRILVKKTQNKLRMLVEIAKVLRS
ncbi:MAG: signal recognition particle subunit SRP19/SEC65 family protein [Thermoplasmata archaeon]